MFNAPRQGRTGASGGLASSAFLNSTSETTSFDPLAASMPSTSANYGEVDPWSSTPTPTIGTPRRTERQEQDGPDAGDVSSLIADVQGVSAREGLQAFLREPSDPCQRRVDLNNEDDKG